MAVFAYKGVDVGGAVLDGTVIADSPRAARDALRGRGLTVTGVRAVARAPGRAGGRGAPAAQVTAAARELATLLESGVPLVGALDTLLDQHGGRTCVALQQVRDQVAAGSGLAEAMAAQPRTFDALAVSIVRVGEATGTLEEALAHLADLRERREGLTSRVATALVYPAIVAVVGTGVAVFLMTGVVPDLLAAVDRPAEDLPAVTRLVKGASDALLAWGWLALALAAVVAVGLRAVAATEWGRYGLDRAVLALPLVGPLVRKEQTARMAVVLGALLRSGLRFEEASRVTRATLRNRVFRRALEAYEEAVIAGRDIAAPLAASGVFPPVVVRMLAVGQASGRLEALLDRVAAALDREVETATRRLTAALEPALIVAMAVLVGLVAMATILPILEASHVL